MPYFRILKFTSISAFMIFLALVSPPIFIRDTLTAQPLPPIATEEPVPPTESPPTATTPVHNAPSPGNNFNPGDARINIEAHAPAVVFCTDNNSVEVWVVINAQQGELAFNVSSDGIHTAAEGSQLGSGRGVTLYKLEAGHLQLNATQSDGKGYIFIWNGCPMTAGVSYIVENGVPIPTGIFND